MNSGPPAAWQEQITSTIDRLRSSNLLRVQRPTIPLLSSTEALISTDDLHAWAAGQPAGPNHTLASPIITAWTQSDSRRTDSWPFPSQPEPASLHSQLPSQQESAGQQWQPCTVQHRGLPHQQPQGSGTISQQPAFLQQTAASTWGQGPCQLQQEPCVHGGCTSLPAAFRVPGGRQLQTLKLFSLNDYLGLASHPEVCEAAAQAARQYGLGSRSSAIVGGTSVLHRQLEEELAQLKGTEDCLLFPTGFAANMAVVSGLAGLGGPVVILSDELNHASIIDGARLAVRGTGQVTLRVYRHNDLEHLEEMLRKLLPGARAMVVTDSLFSMDGDFADLKGLARLRSRYGFLLVVDEAHATLVVGERGGGAAEVMGVAEQVDVHVGTLSKAFGALGGFVASSRAIKELLVNKGRSYVYSTALPLPVVAAAQAALMVSKRESWRRAHVWSLVRRLGAGLGVPAISPIIPLVVGSEQEALRLSALTLRQGMHVPAIRPPTVPPGTCRLRVSLSAAHTTADVDHLIHMMQETGARFQALPHLVQQQDQQRREGWSWPYGWPAVQEYQEVPQWVSPASRL